MKTSDEPLELDENGFPVVYTPDRCERCNHQIDPMYPYLSFTVPNTDSPQVTVYHFCSGGCLISWREAEK